MKKLILLAIPAACLALLTTVLFAKTPIAGIIYPYSAGACSVKSSLPEYVLGLLDDKEPLISEIYEYRVPSL